MSTYIDESSQLAKIELLLDEKFDNGYKYTIEMSQRDRLKLIKEIHQRRA